MPISNGGAETADWHQAVLKLVKESSLSEYTIEMFHTDYETVIPVIMKYRDLESLEAPKEEVKPENAFMDIVGVFLEKYGNARGTDYQMRFLSVMQFIEHYAKDLLKDGLIVENQDITTRIPNEILSLLLDSFKAPQAPNPYPSSWLHNTNHEFNYKKVLKAYKTAHPAK
jgi:hypothetical protein